MNGKSTKPQEIQRMFVCTIYKLATMLKQYTTVNGWHSKIITLKHPFINTHTHYIHTCLWPVHLEAQACSFASFLDILFKKNVQELCVKSIRSKKKCVTWRYVPEGHASFVSLLACPGFSHIHGLFINWSLSTHFSHLPTSLYFYVRKLH